MENHVVKPLCFDLWNEGKIKGKVSRIRAVFTSLGVDSECIQWQI